MIKLYVYCVLGTKDLSPGQVQSSVNFGFTPQESEAAALDAALILARPHMPDDLKVISPAVLEVPIRAMQMVVSQLESPRLQSEPQVPARRDPWWKKMLFWRKST
jgi:hypothetical protein